MASAVVASTSATAAPPTPTTTTTTTTTTAVAKRNDHDGDDPENHHNEASSTAMDAPSGDGDNVAAAATAAVAKATTALIDGQHSRNSNPNPNPNNHYNFHEKHQHLPQTSPIKSHPHPHTDKLRSDTPIGVGTAETHHPSLSSSSSPSAAKNIDNGNDCHGGIPGRTVATKRFGEGPLPRELRRIIMEVAKTGKCSWLSWNQETTTLLTCTRREGYGYGYNAPSASAATASAGDAMDGGDGDGDGNCSGDGDGDGESKHNNLPASASKASPFKVASSASAMAYTASSSSSSSRNAPSALSNAPSTGGGGTVRKHKNKHKHAAFGGGGAAATTQTATSTPAATATATQTPNAARRSTGQPPRKRHRNGVIHKKGGERMRFGYSDGAFARGGPSPGSRKRPLVLVRTNHNGAGSANPTGNSIGIGNNSNTNTNTGNNALGNNLWNANPNANAPGSTLSSPGTATSTSALIGGVYSSAPSSVGSGRSTGSEPDYDSAPYECDSEGTSATTNSEISLRKTTRAKRSGASNTPGAQINNGVDTWTDTATMGDGEDENNSVDGTNAIPGSPYKTLQTAFRGALGLVLDHFYQNRDNGYKLSPAEKRRNERFAETVNANSHRHSHSHSHSSSSGNNSSSSNNNNVGGDSAMNSDKLASLLSSEYVFQQRRQRLMAMLLPSTHHVGHDRIHDEPPFTIQRIAEVLVAPDRYYTQTHKLCNCLEKLLLVNSSTDSFGGSAGGDTSQRRREERELAALADEKGRQEFKLRQQRRLTANRKAPIDDWFSYDHHADAFSSSSPRNDCPEDEPPTRDESSTIQNVVYESKQESLVGKSASENGPIAATSNNESMASTTTHIPASMTHSASSSSQEMLEALARASLQTKFDNVGIDSQQQNPSNSNNNNKTERDLRAITENRAMTSSPPLPGLNMTSAAANISIPNHGGVNGFVRQHLSEQQPPQNPDHQSVARVGSPILFPHGNEPHLETTSTNMHMLQLHHAVALAGATLNRTGNLPTLENLMTIDANSISQMRSQTNAAGPGSESTDGRSSASNSDIDSESDDISFDDSASDRSDGSDSGSTSAHYEPFTAARAMALNRMQQQQRLQSRVLTSLGTSAQGEGFRPLADSEYQSGDSIDSTRTEDSGGSDSSSSDMTD